MKLYINEIGAEDIPDKIVVSDEYLTTLEQELNTYMAKYDFDFITEIIEEGIKLSIRQGQDELFNEFIPKTIFIGDIDKDKDLVINDYFMTDNYLGNYMNRFNSHTERLLRNKSERLLRKENLNMIRKLHINEDYSNINNYKDCLDVLKGNFGKAGDTDSDGIYRYVTSGNTLFLANNLGGWAFEYTGNVHNLKKYSIKADGSMKNGGKLVKSDVLDLDKVFNKSTKYAILTPKDVADFNDDGIFSEPRMLTWKPINKSDVSVTESASDSSDIMSLIKDIPEKDIDHWETDLYLRKTPETTKVISKLPDVYKKNVTTFIDDIDHVPWYEIPFVFPKDRNRKGIKESADDVETWDVYYWDKEDMEHYNDKVVHMTSNEVKQYVDRLNANMDDYDRERGWWDYELS